MAERRAAIRFYAALKRRVVDVPWPAGAVPAQWLLTGAPLEYDSEADAQRRRKVPGLDGLTFGTRGTAYVKDPFADDSDPLPDIHFAEVVESTASVLHVRMWRMRMAQLPSLHDLESGKTTPMKLAKTQGLAEAVDFMFFLKSAVVGVLVNRAGPSTRAFTEYVAQQTAVHLKLVPLTREDALELVNGNRVTEVEVEVVSGHFEALANITPELGEAGSRLNKRDGLRSMTVAFGAERDDRAKVWSWFKTPAKKLIGMEKGVVKKLSVTESSDENFHAQVLDLLSQHIGLEVGVPLATGRTVDAEAAGQALKDGFNQYIEQIRAASDRLDSVAENQRNERKKPGPKAST